MTQLPLLPLLLAEVPAGLRQALAQEGVACQEHSAAPAAGRFVLYDSRRGACRLAVEGQVGIDVHALRAGFAKDPFELLLDEGAARQHWQIGPLSVSEEVARVDKPRLRGKLMPRLRLAVEAAGGLWLKLSAWPFPYRSAFNFRLDHDEYEAADFDATLRVIAGHEHAFSHYVCGSTHHRHADALARLQGADVGSHGYWHHTYYQPQENLKNIRRGILALEKAGLRPSGYVSPHGRFNRGLLWALEQLGVTHSSEFGFAYDDLPQFPAGSNVLQIPVHPVCLGIFLEAARKSSAASRGDRSSQLEARRAQAVREASEYFQRLLEAKYQAGEPIFLYGHPDGRIGRYPQLLAGVLQAASQCAALWMTDRTTLASWWRQRAAVRWQLLRDGDTYLIQADNMPASQRLAVEYWRGEHVALMPLDQQVVRFSPEALAWQPRKPFQWPRSVRVDRRRDLKTRLRSYLDWEKVTPLEEIDGGTLRGWMKKTLRRVRK